MRNHKTFFIIFILLIRIIGDGLYNLLLLKGWGIPISHFVDAVEVVETLNPFILRL